MGSWCVYKITCKTEGKSYIGITQKKIQTRLNEHFRDAFPGRIASNGKLYALHAAIQKHGKNNFSIELLIDNLSLEQAQKQEVLLIKKYNTYGGGKNKKGLPRGYNITKGGETPDFSDNRLNLTQSKSTKPNMKTEKKSYDKEFSEKFNLKNDDFIYILLAIVVFIGMFLFFTLAVNLKIAIYIYLYLIVIFVFGVIFVKDKF